MIPPTLNFPSLRPSKFKLPKVLQKSPPFLTLSHDSTHFSNLYKFKQKMILYSFQSNQ